MNSPDNRELKNVTFLSRGQQPEMNILHARAVVSRKFLTASSLMEESYLAI